MTLDSVDANLQGQQQFILNLSMLVSSDGTGSASMHQPAGFFLTCAAAEDQKQQQQQRCWQDRLPLSAAAVLETLPSNVLSLPVVDQQRVTAREDLDTL
jgi:hypothetical protein